MEGFCSSGVAFDDGDVFFRYVEKCAKKVYDFLVGKVFFCRAGDMYVNGMSPWVIVSWKKLSSAVWGDMEMDETTFWCWC